MKRQNKTQWDISISFFFFFLAGMLKVIFTISAFLIITIETVRKGRGEKEGKTRSKGLPDLVIFCICRALKYKRSHSDGLSLHSKVVHDQRWKDYLTFQNSYVSSRSQFQDLLLLISKSPLATESHPIPPYIIGLVLFSEQPHCTATTIWMFDSTGSSGIKQ